MKQIKLKDELKDIDTSKIDDNSFLKDEIKKKYEFMDFLEENKIKCNICEQVIKCGKKQGRKPLDRHCLTTKHIENFKNKKENKLNIKENNNIQIMEWMLINNIPISKLDDKDFTSLFENILNTKLYSSTHCRKHFMPEYYKQKRIEILNKFENEFFYIMFDESPDKNGRKILNILIGSLNEMKPVKPYLIETIEIDSVNSETISDVLNFLVVEIIKNPKSKNNFKILISDKAAYCLKTGQILKILYPNLIHITCLCHGLHNFATYIKNKTKKCVEFEREFKLHFKNNSKKKKEFKKKTNKKIPKYPVATRWGTWIEFFIDMYDNWQFYEPYFESLDNNENLKKFLHNDEFFNEIIVLNLYRNLPNVILYLEKSELTISQQWNAVENFGKTISNEEYYNEFKRIFESNPGYKFFSNYNVLKCPYEQRILNYCPLTSVWVERSFSSFKFIFNDLRRKMKVKTIKMLLFFYFNKKL